MAWAGGTQEKLDEQAKDFNLIIGKAVSKANDVFAHFRLSGYPITSESFLLDYNTEANKQDFDAYMEAKLPNATAKEWRTGKALASTPAKTTSAP